MAKLVLVNVNRVKPRKNDLQKRGRKQSPAQYRIEFVLIADLFSNGKQRDERTVLDLHKEIFFRFYVVVQCGPGQPYLRAQFGDASSQVSLLSEERGGGCYSLF